MLNEKLVVNKRHDAIVISRVGDETILALLEMKRWESEFFNRKYATLTIKDAGSLGSYSNEEVADSLLKMMKTADQENFHLTELHIDINNIQLIPILEDAGFRLVDTRMTFITLISREEFAGKSTGDNNFAYAAPQDLDAIVHLTSQCFVKNDHFFSRFKNERFYSQEEIENYYNSWIANHLDDRDTYFIVMKFEEKVYAYFIYKKHGLYQNKSLYKGILTAVDPGHRGKSLHLQMQHFLYNQFPEKEFYVDNTTQLTNIPTIKNHIKSQKQLNRIELTFYRTMEVGS